MDTVYPLRDRRQCAGYRNQATRSTLQAHSDSQCRALKRLCFRACLPVSAEPLHACLRQVWHTWHASEGSHNFQQRSLLQSLGDPRGVGLGDAPPVNVFAPLSRGGSRGLLMFLKRGVPGVRHAQPPEARALAANAAAIRSYRRLGGAYGTLQGSPGALLLLYEHEAQARLRVGVRPDMGFEEQETSEAYTQHRPLSIPFSLCTVRLRTRVNTLES